MIRVAILVRVFLAFAVVISTIAITLSGPDLAIANERDEAESSNSETPPIEESQLEVYTVTREYSATHEGKDGKHGKQGKQRRGTSHNRGKRHVGTEAFEAKRNGTSVRLYPTLGVSDYGPWEDVRGRVRSSTTARANDVRRMRIGGALLQANHCRDAYDDPDPVPTEQTFSSVKSGESPWTNYYRGFNDCWYQTGHNYFRITLSNGNLWDHFVTGDVFIDL